MRQYIVRRLLQGVLILVILSIAVFVLLRIAPGADPALLKCGLMCTDERYEVTKEDMGLNDPYVVQYGSWVKQRSCSSPIADASSFT